MSERENIFARIREALQTPSPLSLHGGVAHETNAGASQNRTSRKWLPLVGTSFDERVTLFSRNAADLKAEFYLLDDWGAASNLLLQMRESGSWKLLGTHQGDLTEAARKALGLPTCHTDQPYDVNELESCDAAITECDALIAQTGSVLVTGRSAGGRALSVLPPHHVVLARREQLIGDLTDAFDLLKQKYGEQYPSFISFITGPSRTGDIERVLVLGAHGPRKLTILCF